MDDNFQTPKIPTNNTLRNKIVVFGLVITIVAFLSVGIFLSYIISASADFPQNTLYTISKGQSVSSVATDLENSGYIRSAFWFKVYFRIAYDGKDLNYGDYSLKSPINLVTLANRLATGDYKIAILKTTIPEGYTNKQIGSVLEEKYFKITNAEFSDWTKKYEGYIFPDTYLWPMNISTQEAVSAMILNFEKITKDIKTQSQNQKQVWSDVIKVASIIEMEANTEIDRHIVSDILWRRLAIGMPLQVNATLKYIGIKDTFVLTNDKKAIESPYNTYLHRGLPPTPICNPGLQAIDAAVNPTKTKYLYFLTGYDGKMYYAKSYDEHLANRAKYLK